MKTCTKCGECKSPDDFYRRAKSPDGLAYMCKPCVYACAAHPLVRARKNERRRGDEVTLAKQRAYKAANRPALNIARADWERRNPEKSAAMRKTDSRRRVDRLTDWYVVLCLKQNSGLERRDIPPPLIEAKRLQLQIKRLANQTQEKK